MFVGLNLQETQAERLGSELKKIKFERVELGFGSKDARSQLDELKAQNDRLETVIAEKNAEIKSVNQERTRLSFRVQELKKSILGMVPRGEVEATWKEMGVLKEKVREAQRDGQNWKSKFEALSDETGEVDDVINYLTPRPGAAHLHFLACHSFSHTDLKIPCAEQTGQRLGSMRAARRTDSRRRSLCKGFTATSMRCGWVISLRHHFPFHLAVERSVFECLYMWCWQSNAHCEVLNCTCARQGLTGDDADWDDENDQFDGFGKSKDLPLYLQWEGKIRNRHFSKREMDQFIGEIFHSKKK